MFYTFATESITTAVNDLSAVIDVSQIGSQNNWELQEVKLHLATSATGANTFTVRQKSKRGDKYDTVLLAQPMVSVQDVLWQPDYAIKLNGKDKIEFTWTNDSASMKNWGLQAHYRL